MPLSLRLLFEIHVVFFLNNVRTNLCYKIVKLNNVVEIVYYLLPNSMKMYRKGR